MFRTVFWWESLAFVLQYWYENIMTSSIGNIFRVTGPVCGEFIGHRWIPLTKASDAGLWCVLWSAPWINGWVNNREAGDLRRNRAHYDVIVMNKVANVDILPTSISQTSVDVRTRISNYIHLKGWGVISYLPLFRRWFHRIRAFVCYVHPKGVDIIIHPSLNQW